MKCLLVAINAKYIHSNLAVYNLKACAEAEAEKKNIPSGIQVEIVEYTINHRAAEILDDIYMRKADMLCFSCYIWNIEYVKALIKNLKRLRPEVPVWLGGPEVSFGLEERLGEIPEADGILYGEGEKSFPQLLQFYAGGRVEKAAARQYAPYPAGNAEAPFSELQESLPLVPSGLPDGCAYRAETGQIVVTPPQEFTDMDEIPFVYRGIWEKEDFRHRILYYETSRGCPFSCSYCLSSTEKKLRFRSLSLVYGELDFFLEKKVPQVKFVDRTFNCRKDRTAAIWTYLREHDNGVTNFHFEIGAELLDEELLSLLQTLRPGLIRLEIGVQSANPKTLEAICRITDFEKLNLVANRTGRSKNVLRHLDLIAGLPYEGYESFGRSFDEVYLMKPDELQLGFLKVLKGTPMYEEAERYHILYQAEAPFEVLETPWLSHGELIRLKQVEEMVEIYYNSRQFMHTLEFLLPFFERPFLLYEALGKAYAERGMGRRKHARAALYGFLLDFLREEVSGNRTAEEERQIREILTLDYYLRENAKGRPDFAFPEEPYRAEIRARLARRFPETPVKQLLRETHVEALHFPIVLEEAPVLSETYWMFDYENRDPLTGNAALIRL